jgi:hypothetical protein
MMGRQPGMAKGMSEMYKEASKIDGVPVLQVIRMGGSMQGMSEKDMAQAQQAAAEAERTQQQQGPPPSAGDVAGQAATGAALGRMGKVGGIASGIGGFGGFGRKKKAAEQEQPQQQAQTPPPAPPAASQTGPGAVGPTPPGTLMELTSELTAFSSAAVDAAKFAVPSGFKQVEHEMQKALK